MTGFKKSLCMFAILVLMAGYVIWGVVWLRGLPAKTLFERYSPEMMILTSPDRNRTVFLFAEGFTDTDISLCVRSSKDDSSIERIVRLRFQDFDAAWSRDCSVLAFGDGDQYFFAYDFKSGHAVASGKDYLVDGSNRIDPVDSESIKALIRERGAPTYSVPCSPQSFVSIRYSDWEKLRAALYAFEHPGERNPWRK
jgi:hypothetical protein